MRRSSPQSRALLFTALCALAACEGQCFKPPPQTTLQTGPVSGDAPTQVWAVRAGRRLTGRVVLKDGQLYGAGVDRKVYAVDMETGEVQWSSRLSGLVAGGVLVSGDTVFAASSRKSLGSSRVE